MFKSLIVSSLTLLLSVGSLAIVSNVKASEANDIETTASTEKVDPWTNTDIQAVVKVSNEKGAHLYTSDGKVIHNRRLAPWTSWYTDIARVASNKDNISNPVHKGTYYRVSTNEYVRGIYLVTPTYNQLR